jgi:SAM-dependent methyltransferase
LRHRVLFELWAPQAGAFVARFVLCDACGLVAYAPRPTADEIDAKYRMIASDPGDDAATAPRVGSLDRERSGELYATLFPHLPPTPGRLLDFGGGDGALTACFADAGFRCGVVDYTPTLVPGVERLGATLDDLPDDARFELVLCSHVLEHVAEPVEITRVLASRLAPDGLLLVEVPLEILGGVPRLREPVTHVSFFCESSLVTVLRRAGLEVVDCHTRACLFANGRYHYGVRAVARLSRSAASPALPGSATARRLLAMNAIDRLSMRASQPRALLAQLRSVVRRALPSRRVRA